MRYQFLADTYETEIVKVLSVWSMFHDEDLSVRPHPTDVRGRSVREHMVHQCVSEDTWFRTMLGVDVQAPPLPASEDRIGFIQRYAIDAPRRLALLRRQDDGWFEQQVRFFEVVRSRAWVLVRRIAHTSHHRGQQMAMLRMLNREIHSNYGPTADTGGLMQHGAPVIYAYPDLETLCIQEAAGGRKAVLPGPGVAPSTERPE